MLSRRLVLKKETFTELGSSELRGVVGGGEGTHGLTCSPTGLTLCEICVQPRFTTNCPPVPTYGCPV